MADTSYTSNYQIKVIGTGREGGTWGDSTSENLKRIEAVMGSVQSINIESMPIGSISADGSNSWTATWITIDASDTGSGQSGSEGRTRAVVLSDGATVASPPTLNIRGSSSDEVPSRVLFIWNNLTTDDIIIDGGTGVDVTIANGYYAVVAIIPTTKGGLLAGVHNLLSSLQIANLSLTGGDILIPASGTSAFKIHDGTNDYVEIDADNQIINIDQAISLATIEIADVTAEALIIKDSVGATFVKLNTSAELIELEKTVSIKSSVFLVDNQATIIGIKDNESAALSFAQSSNSYLNLDTTDGAERVRIIKKAVLDELALSASAEILFGSEAFDGTGYGFRDNGGEIEVKNTGEDWGVPYTTGLVSGSGTYFKSSANLALGTTNFPINGGSTEAHSIGASPRLLSGMLVCIVADNGFSIGDEIDINSLYDVDQSDAPVQAGVSYGANATNVFFGVSEGISLTLVHKGGTTSSSITLASWDIHIHAWK